LKKRQMINSG